MLLLLLLLLLLGVVLREHDPLPPPEHPIILTSPKRIVFFSWSTDYSIYSLFHLPPPCLFFFLIFVTFHRISTLVSFFPIIHSSQKLHAPSSFFVLHFILYLVSADIHHPPLNLPGFSNVCVSPTPPVFFLTICTVHTAFRIFITTKIQHQQLVVYFCASKSCKNLLIWLIFWLLFTLESACLRSFSVKLETCSPILVLVYIFFMCLPPRFLFFNFFGILVLFLPPNIHTYT